MSFQISTTGIPRLDSYDAAKACFERIKPWRGYSEDHERPLDANRSIKSKTIRIRRDGAVACRLHNTDVVSYHPDGAIEIVGYASMSTNSFARQLLRGAGIAVDFTGYGSGYLVGTGSWQSGIHWWSGGHVRMRDGVPVETDRFPTHPIVQYVFDRQAGAMALKEYRYRDFVDWYAARLVMRGGELPRTVDPRSLRHCFKEIMQAGPTEWVRLGGRDLVGRVRQEIYLHSGAVGKIEHASVDNNHLAKIIASQRAWSYAGL